MKRTYLVFLGLSILLVACDQKPVVDASISPAIAHVGENVQFTSYCQNTAYVEWNLGDGTISSEYNPIHVYDSSGVYLVSLKAFGKRGDVKVAYYYLEILNWAPLADAVISPNPAWVGEDILFQSTSQNAEYLEWDLGDGGKSSLEEFTYYYENPGVYEIFLEAINRDNEVSKESFLVEIEGSELRIIVKEYYEEYIVENASVLLYKSQEDWYEADVEKAVGEVFTDENGECWFDNLSFQEYYVDVYYRIGNEGYVNWMLGEEDIKWVETQELPGGYDHTFIAWVDAVTFDDQQKSTGRPNVRSGTGLITPVKKHKHSRSMLKENKISVRKDVR